MHRSVERIEIRRKPQLLQLEKMGSTQINLTKLVAPALPGVLVLNRLRKYLYMQEDQLSNVAPPHSPKLLIVGVGDAGVKSTQVLGIRLMRKFIGRTHRKDSDGNFHRYPEIKFKYVGVVDSKIDHEVTRNWLDDQEGFVCAFEEYLSGLSSLIILVDIHDQAGVELGPLMTKAAKKQGIETFRFEIERDSRLQQTDADKHCSPEILRRREQLRAIEAFIEKQAYPDEPTGS